MSLPLLSGVFLLLLFLGYHFYGRFIAKYFRLNPQTKTPAHEFEDGEDYVPTKPFYLLGQHFSAIAAAGPIAGPILACQQFGWLPCLLWIGIGVIFIGAVHDLSSLVASVRHKGHSIAEIIRINIGERAFFASMIFIWISLIYVIIAFTDLTAHTFVGQAEEFENLKFSFNPGGAVAIASIIYLGLSMLMGLIQKKLKAPLWLLTLIFVPATLGAVYLGTKFSTLLIYEAKTWSISILVYCFIASLLPLWLLLQPRGYLGGFVLYLALFVGTVGIFFGGYEIAQPAFKTWHAEGATGALFPFLFVTIACGACSGFHGLVCSGTTSKQIDRESDCRPVGYGAMLLEAFVALIALATIMILSDSQMKGTPGSLYGQGIGKFLTLIIGEKNLAFATTFGAMAFSTFVFDTLDVTTRLGRYILQELFHRSTRASAWLATLVTVSLPLIFILNAGSGGWRNFWVLFGTSNQLLAGLTLLAVTVWLYRAGRKYWFTLIPMLFVMAITFWSLAEQIRAPWSTSSLGSIVKLNAGVALALLLLAIFVIGCACQAVKHKPNFDALLTQTKD